MGYNNTSDYMTVSEHPEAEAARDAEHTEVSPTVKTNLLEVKVDSHSFSGAAFS